MRGFVLSILLLSLPVQAQAKTLHVSLSGDGGDGTTGGKAFCSIAAGTAEQGVGDGGCAQFFQDAANLASGDALEVSLGHGQSQCVFAPDPLLERRGIGVDITTDLGDGELSPGNSEKEDGQPMDLLETGSDFPISDPEGYGYHPAIFGFPAIVWNSQDRNYFAVWFGNSNSPSEYRNAKYVYGELLSATGFQSRVDNLVISDIDVFIFYPSVAWNSSDNEYLSVWSLGIETSIHGQIVTSSGEEIASNDFQIEDTGLYSESTAVAWNATQREYLVVWAARNIYAGYSVIYCRRCSADGQPLGDEPTLVSEVPDPFSYSNTAGASHPAVVWNASDNEYLVVWEGWNQDFGMVKSDRWIFAQLLRVYLKTLSRCRRRYHRSPHAS